MEYKEHEPAFGYDLEGYQYLGRGYRAVPPGVGWGRSPRVLYRCVQCGDTMPADWDNYFDCTCGAMYLDYDAGRFGSSLGDSNILSYVKKQSS